MYPQLQINLSHIKENINRIIDLCQLNDISVTGVVKGCGALNQVVECFVESKCTSIGSSRIRQLKSIKETYGSQTMLLRTPMLSEVDQVVLFSDISLNSELLTLKALELAAKINQKSHGVILMYDVGDLREGVWDKRDIYDLARFVESSDSLVLKGIGTNIGCYGSVKPSRENLSDLVEVSEKIEAIIGRSLEIISGGATSSLTLVKKGDIPKRINHLRLGEGILLGKDLPIYYNCDLKLHDDTFILKAQLVEIKNKPSHPVGELMVNAFGNKPDYEDRGIERRGILAIGKQDFGHHDKLIPIDDTIKVIGSSSDHLIVVINNDDYEVGDSILFEMFYQSMLYLSLSPDVKKHYMI